MLQKVKESKQISTLLYGDDSYMLGTLPYSRTNINLKNTLLHYTLCAN